jgi:hypothetical protein
VILQEGGPDGRRVGCQAWAPAPGIRTYWYLVKDPAFPGEMRMITFDAKGEVSSIDPTVYNAQGKQAHERDGSECTGSQHSFGAPRFAHSWGCHGCNVLAAERLVGRPVKIVLAGDPSYGRTVRWGTLREVRGGLGYGAVAVFDGLHDSAGIHDGPRHDGNGVEFKISDLLELE